MIAVIEIGSNTVKFLCGSAERFLPTRLSKGLAKTGKIDRETMFRCVDRIAALKDEAFCIGADEIVCVATAVLRDAANAEDFKNALLAETGLEVRVLTGEEEGRLTYKAVSSIFATEFALADIGGASTEITTADKVVSLKLGSMKATDMFADPEDAYKYFLSIIPKDFSSPALAASGGTAVSYAKITHPEREPNGVFVTREELEEAFRRLAAATAEERREIMYFDPPRADVITAGGAILRAAADFFNADGLTVTTRSLRHALV